MGQYHLTVNLDKHEYLHPHKLGCGLKLGEQISDGTSGGIGDALVLLLACSNGRGGGDFRTDSDMIGRWAGDRIAVVGDYAEDGDLPEEHAAGSIYQRCHEPEEGETWIDPAFRDITDELIPVLEREFDVVYAGSGWRTRVDAWKVFGVTSTYYGGASTVTDRVAELKDGRLFRLDDLIDEARKRAGEPGVKFPLEPQSEQVGRSPSPRQRDA